MKTNDQRQREGTCSGTDGLVYCVPGRSLKLGSINSSVVNYKALKTYFNACWTHS